MGVETRGKRRRRLEEEQELVVDRISGLPDGVLGDIVSLLPTKDGARTQLLSSRWRHLWRSAPLNLELHISWRRVPAGAISHVLAAHPGPSRRFSIDYSSLLKFSYYNPDAAASTLDGWLRSPAINGLQELEILFDHSLLRWAIKPLPLPPSVLRLSSTLTIAIFGACVLPDCANNNNGKVLQWPFLKKLTLFSVTVSESSLHALLAGCSAIDSLLLQENNGFSQLRIMSPSLRSIGVSSLPGLDDDNTDDDDTVLEQLVVEDAPCLERLLFSDGLGMSISVISAPRLNVLGELQDDRHMLQFGTSALQVQGSTVASLTAVVQSVRVLALPRMKPCLDAVINLMKCFPHLEKLHIEITHVGEENEPYDKYQDHANTLDIRLRNIVLAYFYDRKSHIEFAKFLILNARVLESMTLQLKFGRVGNNAWIREQRRLLQVEKRASKGARFDFVSRIGSFSLPVDKQVHDLSILDPFQRIH
ncbi:unnamed protein product [Urochloa decumbens]|uniref:F-box domain-containing protein n=1 Tax=Urochloa decumbens TaxID=240449 RepID=A0ABC9FN81_9POAL